MTSNDKPLKEPKSRPNSLNISKTCFFAYIWIQWWDFKKIMDYP